MTTITITRDSKKHRWVATSDTPSLPKMLRIVPALEEHYPQCTAMHAVEMVRQCNPGCKVVLGMSDSGIRVK